MPPRAGSCRSCQTLGAMHAAVIPSREQWGDLDVDPEARYGFELLGGKAVEEAAPLFTANPSSARLSCALRLPLCSTIAFGASYRI